MIFELLKRAIEQNNVFMTKDMIQLMTEMFYTAGKITDTEHTEIINMLSVGETPPIVE
jgi:hypothetical protein